MYASPTIWMRLASRSAPAAVCHQCRTNPSRSSNSRTPEALKMKRSTASCSRPRRAETNLPLALPRHNTLLTAWDDQPMTLAMSEAEAHGIHHSHL